MSSSSTSGPSRLPLRPESGYDGWLRYQAPNDFGQLAAYRQLCSHLVVTGCSALLSSAQRELARGLGAMLGQAVAVAPGPPAGSPHLLLGTAQSPDLARLLGGAGVPSPPSQGFVLMPVPAHADQAAALALVGGDDQGCLYGAFALLRRVAMGTPVPTSPMQATPAAPLRIIEHWDNIDGSVERGYAGRSIFFDAGAVTSDLRRVSDYARLLASVGVNTVAINNVNVDSPAMALLTQRHLRRLAEVAGELRAYGIRMILSVSFASPVVLGGLPSADPLSPATGQWWSDVACRVYEHIPDLWGFLVKAGSEGQPGPHAYGRTHAQGANVLAQAVRPYGGNVIWRAFVYNCDQDWRDGTTDRAKAAFEELAPLDGQFADNVVLQVKAGPMDFQVREPPSPLFGSMDRTDKLLEVQLAQEYTGQQVHLCYLVPSWAKTLCFDTCSHGEASTVADLVVRGTSRGTGRAGMVGVANVGDDPNWTGHLLAQANLYGFGRLAWSPELTPQQIAQEWSQLTFGTDDGVTQSLVAMLMSSWATYESYTSPLGLGWMVTPGGHYGPSVDGYEYSRWGTYHRADSVGVGVDRTAATGTGFTSQYHEPWCSIFEDPAQCPEELLLFFHRLSYSHRLSSGKTLVQHIYDTHFEGVATVERYLAEWRSLEDRIDVVRHRSVERRLVQQLHSAEEWRDVVNAYFHRKSGAPDEKGRRLF